MPMLPSGRHIGINPEPLRNLLDDWKNPVLAHKIMAIKGLEDLFAWLGLVDFVPAAEATEDDRARALPIQHGMPPGILPVATDQRLCGWRVLAEKWSEVDRAAMESFILDRVRPHYERSLDAVRELQQKLVSNGFVLAGMFATMAETGCHPLQDESTVAGELPLQGVYARLAAMLFVNRLLGANPQIKERHSITAMRVEGMLKMCGSHFALLYPKRDELIDGYFRRPRDADPLSDSDPTERAWFAQQTGIECEEIWNHLGEDLRILDAATYDIVELAALSGAAGGAGTPARAHDWAQG